VETRDAAVATFHVAVGVASIALITWVCLNALRFIAQCRLIAEAELQDSVDTYVATHAEVLEKDAEHVENLTRLVQMHLLQTGRYQPVDKWVEQHVPTLFSDPEDFAQLRHDMGRAMSMAADGSSDRGTGQDGRERAAVPARVR